MYITSPLLVMLERRRKQTRNTSLSLSEINSEFHDEYHFRLAILQRKYVNVKTGENSLH